MTVAEREPDAWDLAEARCQAQIDEWRRMADELEATVDGIKEWLSEL